MNSIINFISGEVPGGILLLLLILFIVNLSLFFFYRGSRLFTKDEYQKKVTKSSLFIFVIYVSLWFLLRPEQIPDSILFVPFQKDTKSDFVISEILELQAEPGLSENYRLHYWDWFYKTCNMDSINFLNYRLAVAEKLKIDLIIAGQYISNSRVNVIVRDGDESENKQFDFKSYQDLAIKIISWLGEKYNIIDELESPESQYSDETILTLTKAKLLYLAADYEKALKLLSNTQKELVLLKTKILLKKGVRELKENKKSMFKDNDNKYFAKVRNTLIPIAKEGKDTATLNRILGELYLHDKQYEKAEIFLKKGLTQNPYDTRIYYDLYYLHKDRFKDLGFESRFDVLERAIELDNGYVAATHDLANEYFQTGTASASGSGTTLALETLNNFLKINHENKKILNQLANIYLQIKYTERAINIYNKLIDSGNNSGEIYYNLGIGYFHQKNYDNAEIAFKKSISINEYPDSYLYLGAINKLNGNNQKALYYYRERIKHQQGDDDDYAKEAMHGIRIILREQSEDSLEVNDSNN